VKLSSLPALSAALLCVQMIGDENLREDRQRTEGGIIKHRLARLQEGGPSPAGRFAFTNWRLWNKDDPVVQAELLGPVTTQMSKANGTNRVDAGEKDPGAAQRWKPHTNEEALERLKRISASTQFGNCCFWAWELELAILKQDRETAQRIGAVLASLQRADGRWGLGNAWGKREDDFKERLPEDAESWDVAEAANALLDYGEIFGDATFLPHARKAAAYLKTCIRYAGGKPYLPHMAECNNRLQPHSTICTALLFSRIPEYKDLARELHHSGVAMNFFRLVPHEDLKTLDPPLRGPEVNDFEKVQIGYYLQLVGDAAGSSIMSRYWKLSDFNSRRGAAYLVLAYAKLGQWDKARHFADLMRNFQPRQGYEYALLDIIDYVNTTSPGKQR
jgi:hypothetical protein